MRWIEHLRRVRGKHGAAPHRLPPPIEEALCSILGSAVPQVRLVPNSWYARLHGRMAATTRRNVIFLRGSLEQFAADPALVLHEYFHVIRQWRPRRLTRRRYLLEFFRHGYHNNRFECEARDFTAAHLPRMMALLRRRGALQEGMAGNRRPEAREGYGSRLSA